jgi:hypothetical protein
MRIVSAGSYLGPVVVSGGLLQAGSDSATPVAYRGRHDVLDRAPRSLAKSPSPLAEPLTLNGAGRNGTNGALIPRPGHGRAIGHRSCQRRHGAQRRSVRHPLRRRQRAWRLDQDGARQRLQLGGGSGAANTYTATLSSKRACWFRRRARESRPFRAPHHRRGRRTPRNGGHGAAFCGLHHRRSITVIAAGCGT